MVSIDLRSIVDRLNPYCRSAMEKAAAACLSRTHYNVEAEHLWLALLQDEDNDVAKIFRHFQVDRDQLRRDVERALQRYKTGNAGTPAISPRLPRWFRDSWLNASLKYGAQAIRSGDLVLSFVTHEELMLLAREVSNEFKKVKVEVLEENLRDLVAETREDQGVAAAVGAPGAARTLGTGTPRKPGQAKTEALDQFTRDLTQAARDGKIDPILGRDREIRQIVDILLRRRKNNPILTGEAGVGKTAVVEGFALRIAEGDVPEALQNVSLRTLDLGLLQAGAGIKGEFEKRLQGVLEEVTSSPTPIILFIDEAHTLIGAGGPQGGSDAANLLKPALARGELRTIAATTWAEYKKYFEQDAALERRFQVIMVEEPALEQAAFMMRGIAPSFERHHGVRVLDEAVEASVNLSSRYITGRQLPDKSVDVLDTACARVALALSSTPAMLDDLRWRIRRNELEQERLLGERIDPAQHGERLGELEQQKAQLQEEFQVLETRLEEERACVARIHELRDRLAAPEEEVPAEERTGLRAEFDRESRRLKEMQGEKPLIRPFVDREAIGEVISAWTGIPVGRMVADEIETTLQLETLLARRVVGQDHALAEIAKRILTSKASLENPEQPIGVFLLVGPSGVGKTETALALTNLFYGGEQNLTTINMSEYQEAHTVSGLKGSPPGYVGYGEGGVLTEAVRRKPYSVVLLDEVEKAHTDVMELFYQVFDKGTLEDGVGRRINFRNTIILLTSNLASDVIMKLCSDPDTAPDAQGLIDAIRPKITEHFKPALVGRMVVVPYYPIGDDVMRRIVRLKIDKVVRRIRENHRVNFGYGDDVVEQIAQRCREVESGARTVDQVLTNTVLPGISREILGRMAKDVPITDITLGIGTDGQFTFQFA